MTAKKFAKRAGFQEHEHTADWELEVWAPDYASLLEQAARGMYALSGVRLNTTPRQLRSLALSAGDRESMLVEFLEELLYYIEMEGIGFDTFHLKIQDDEFSISMEGGPIARIAREIKAVTFHNLKIVETPAGLSVHLVFDV